MQSIYNTTIRPVITEKTTHAQGEGKYTFLVDPNANKIDIQKAIEKTYSTKVVSVNIVPVRKKTRMIGRSKWMTKRQAGKKAIVTLEKGKSIDVMKIHEEKKTKAKKVSTKEEK